MGAASHGQTHWDFCFMSLKKEIIAKLLGQETTKEGRLKFLERIKFMEGNQKALENYFTEMFMPDKDKVNG
jgi:hypothetical protein